MNLSQWITETLGRLLGLEDAQTIQGYEPSLAAPWAHDAVAWLLFGCLALAAVSIVFYARYQRHKPIGARVVLATCRAAVLCLLLLLLAQPILKVTVTSQKQPALWLLFDGTESMAIADELSEAERTALAEAVGLKATVGRVEARGPAPTGQPQAEPTTALRRIDYVKALLAKEDDNLLLKLAEKYRLKAFLFDQPHGVRSLDLQSPPSPGNTSRAKSLGLSTRHLAEQLTTDGQVTAIGEAIDDLARRQATGNVAALVIFSDFDQNSGQAALAAARRLGVKIHTVGVGATAAVDVAVALQAPLVMKKDERSTINVILRQQGLDGEEVTVTLAAKRVGGQESPLPSNTVEGEQQTAPPPSTLDPQLSTPRIEQYIDEKSVTLSGASVSVDFDYTPEQTGRFVLVARVEPITGETVEENNRQEREVTVRDDFLRLLFVEYEPTWEWRFVKEVFHRDKLVGIEGFRTFLRSADPSVRDADAMFLPTMVQARSEFFAHDVIFLGDMPASALSPRFCEMTEEFVRDFGGGLVVLSGPRFGPGQLADTPLARLLPVKVDPSARIFDGQAFRLKLAAGASQYDFMQLGSSERENVKAWDNLGLLPWYQPVERLHPLATALAVHPSRTCVDGRSLQPLIAARRYGRGEVIYLGFNETWRLRRRYGERYYRQFWGQMIHRLGLSHALGSQKRFVIRTDRRTYQPGDQVLLTVEAYDADFQPLGEGDLPEGRLRGELLLPLQPATGTASPAAKDAVPGGATQPLSITQLRKGLFETRLPVFAGGEYRVRVTDPITDEPVEITFKVASKAVERHSAVRNVALQEQLAAVTGDHSAGQYGAGGKSFDLTTVGGLAEQIQLMPKIETSIEIIALWNTWLAFGCVVGLLLFEWLLRKRVNLP